MIELENYTYQDDSELIARFKELISPDNEKNYQKSFLNHEFQLIRQYLDSQGYKITQFPNALHTPSSLQLFANNQIRGFIQTRQGGSQRVPWSERRKLIFELEFVKSGDFVSQVPEDLQSLIKRISLRDATWEQQTDEEKLRTIADVIENLLKTSDGSFIPLNEADFYNLFTDQQLRNFRKQLQVFRHSHEQALESRAVEFDESKKKFLVHLGIVMLIRLNDIKRGGFNDRDEG